LMVFDFYRIYIIVNLTKPNRCTIHKRNKENES